MSSLSRRINKFDGHCHYCGTIVAAEAGVIALQLGRWRTYCSAHRDRATMEDAGGEAAEQPAPVSGGIAARAVAAEKATQPETLSELAKAIGDAGLVPTADALASAMEQAIGDAVAAIANQTADIFNATIPALVDARLQSARPIAIAVGDAPPVTIAQAHKALPELVLAVVAGGSPFLVGPAGSGKTTLGRQIAETLDRPFYMASRVTSEYKLTGYMDAKGSYVRTQFREAYETGGVFLFDEVDASDADALTSFNAALAGKMADFPDGMVARHPDFVAIAAGNTYGRGADREYVGRTQLDAATLDRFQIFEVDYDEDLELQICGDPDWGRYVQKVRAAVAAEKVRGCIVSPRASIIGAKYLAAGMARSRVAEVCIWKGMAADVRSRIEARVF